MDRLRQDLRLAVRSLSRARGFTAAAAATLAASVLPARRAARVDPAVALEEE